MDVLVSSSTNPHYNLALEEYLLKKTVRDVLLLYINQPSIIIGKHQIPCKEINPECLMQNQVLIARRISGGGTVYHDDGNINFSIIKTADYGKQVNFRLYSGYIVDYLKTLGLNPVFNERNNILLNGKKISGNAEFIYKNRVLHHGTLLYNSNLDALNDYIHNKNASFYSSKAVLSVNSDVTNISEHLTTEGSTKNFLNDMYRYFISTYHLATDTVICSDEEVKEIESKCSSKAWNYGYSPDYTFETDNITIKVLEGIVRSIQFKNKQLFKGMEFVNDLSGKYHHPEVLNQALREYAESDFTKVLEVLNLIF